MMKKIFIGLLILIGAFLVYIARQSPEYSISREVTMNAAPEKIFPYINDAQKMNSWNPWMELDPKAQMTFSGPAAGVGAKTSWQGGDKLGTGSATIIESVPNASVKTKLEYVKPFTMTQTAAISLTPNGNQTVVRWSVSGSNPFICRVVSFFMNMDKMIGGTFEKGLHNLKSLVEK